MAEVCFAASESVSDIGPLGQIGNLVEIYVDIEYIKYRAEQGGRVDVFPSPTANDFFDVAGDRCDQFGRFLKSKRPVIDESLIIDWCRLRKARDGDKSMVPDIITNDGDWREFYELKPASTSSIGKGRQKIRNFQDIDAGFQLQYFPGTRWSPNIRQVVWNGTWLGSPAKCFLVVVLHEEALLTYKFCVEVSADTVNEWAIKTMFRMVILAAILSRSPLLVGAAAAILLAPRLRSPLLGDIGWNRRNDASDVRYAQRLLNSWLGPTGQPLLAVDGLFGGNTESAIIAFQRDVASFVNPDGWIAPGQLTMRTLETFQMHQWVTGMDAGFLPMDEMMHLAALGDVGSMLQRQGNEEPEPLSVDSEAMLDSVEVLATLAQQYFDLLHA